MKQHKCIVCGEDVEKVADALCKKIYGRELRKFMCLECLANELETDAETLLQKAEEFKASGCTLFN